jgi:hypothetical protein
MERVLKPGWTLQLFAGDDEAGGILKTLREKKENNDGIDAKKKKGCKYRVCPRSMFHLCLDKLIHT